MSRRDDIIGDLENDFGGLELDSNFDESILCDGDTCRHSECECWDRFYDAVEAQLNKQQDEYIAGMQAVEQLYRAEVNAGIHTPEAEAEQRKLDKAEIKRWDDMIGGW